MSGETHISGLIVYTRPQALAAVRQAVEHMTECEFVAEDAGGKLVFVLETRDTHLITDTIEQIRSLDGVINTVMAYHHYEDEQNLNEEMPDEAYAS